MRAAAGVGGVVGGEMRAVLRPGGEREREGARDDRLIIRVNENLMPVIKRKVGQVEYQAPNEN
jgi:hypothetical protein